MGKAYIQIKVLEKSTGINEEGESLFAMAIAWRCLVALFCSWSLLRILNNLLRKEMVNIPTWRVFELFNPDITTQWPWSLGNISFPKVSTFQAARKAESALTICHWTALWPQSHHALLGDAVWVCNPLPHEKQQHLIVLYLRELRGQSDLWVHPHPTTIWGFCVSWHLTGWFSLPFKRTGKEEGLWALLGWTIVC